MASRWRVLLKALRKRWTKTPGLKAGTMAAYVNLEAQAHAQATPGRTANAPATERALAAEVRQIAYTAQRALSSEIRQYYARGFDLRDETQVQLRNELRAIAEDMTETLNGAASRLVRTAYGVGVGFAEDRLEYLRIREAPDDGSPFTLSFSLPDRAAMAAIANDLFGDLAGQTEQMASVAVGILRTTAGGVLQHAVALGKHPAEAARDLEMELQRKGFAPSAAFKELLGARSDHANPYNGAAPMSPIRTTAEAAAWIADNGPLKFIDRAGREWDLAAYCEMAAHTKLMIAKNEGVRNTMLDAGVTLFMFSRDGSVCPVCGPLEGQIFWLGEGESYGYEVGPEIPVHPNCGHTTIPWVQV